MKTLYNAYFSPEAEKLYGSSVYLSADRPKHWPLHLREVISTEIIVQGSDIMPRYEDAVLVGIVELNSWQRTHKAPVVFNHAADLHCW